MPTPTDDPSTAVFEAHRRSLRALAYRMLGSRAEAEDVVLVDEAGAFSPGPESINEYAQDVSIAFMLALERLSPLERAAFLLHDVFDLDFDEIAKRLGRTAAACRQLAARARQHVRSAEVRNEVSDVDASRLLQVFGRAVARGDVEGLAATLAEDVELLADGGGRVAAVPRPLHGAELIARTLVGFGKSAAWHKLRSEPVSINGWPGIVMFGDDGQPVQTMTFRFGADARIASIYVMRNPDKLAHLGAAKP